MGSYNNDECLNILSDDCYRFRTTSYPTYTGVIYSSGAVTSGSVSDLASGDNYGLQYYSGTKEKPEQLKTTNQIARDLGWE